MTPAESTPIQKLHLGTAQASYAISSAFHSSSIRAQVRVSLLQVL
ncbi:MAG: hypothetical protein N3E49_07085 [Bacteroidia bacterium]|nr:hypothetical protein [Bacteroidia bacterium]